jgi:hypothetical protein
MKRIILLGFAITFIVSVKTYATSINDNKIPPAEPGFFVTDTVPSNDSLAQYTGKYKFPDGSPFTEMTVTLENGKLTASSAGGSSELRRSSGDEFEVVAYGGTATFRRNNDRKITGVHILVADLDMEGTKTE